MTAQASNTITYQFAGQTLTMTGAFGKTASGQLFGTVVDMTLAAGGKEVWTASGLSIDASILPNLKAFQELYPFLFGGNDDITGSSGNDAIASYGGNDRIMAGAGDDYVIAGDGNDTIDGGAGFDTAVFGTAANYTFARNGVGSFTITAKNGESVDTVVNMERVQFGDKVLAADLDANGVSGQAFRLYRAAFDRLPDDYGLRFWQMQMEKGSTLQQIAVDFTKSTEYKNLYSGSTNAQLVNKFYEHILHRTPDAAGVEFWTGVLDNHKATEAQVLVAISESKENVDASVTLIGQGVLLDTPLITF
jgi:Ca2+-binding RTX toxin-like protein